jgi:hypothetical protein
MRRFFKESKIYFGRDAQTKVWTPTRKFEIVVLF